MGFGYSGSDVRFPTQVLVDSDAEVLGVLNNFQLFATHRVGDADCLLFLECGHDVHGLALGEIELNAAGASPVCQGV